MSFHQTSVEIRTDKSIYNSQASFDSLHCNLQKKKRISKVLLTCTRLRLKARKKRRIYLKNSFWKIKLNTIWHKSMCFIEHKSIKKSVLRNNSQLLEIFTPSPFSFNFYTKIEIIFLLVMFWPIYDHTKEKEWKTHKKTPKMLHRFKWNGFYFQILLVHHAKKILYFSICTYLHIYTGSYSCNIPFESWYSR